MENENLLASNVDYLKECLEALKEYKSLQREQEEYEKSIKQYERELEGEEKSMRDEKELTIRKRKEEIASSFDKEIRKVQDKIRKIKNDRDRAKSKGIAGRIEMETQDIREENSEIHLQIRSLIKENGLPAFCRYHAYYILFYPKGVEYIFLLAVMAVCMMAIPYGIFLLMPKAEKTPVTMLLITFFCAILFFFLYQVISNHTKASRWDAVRQIRALRDKIVANNKKIRAIRNAVQKDKDEDGYNLEGFDQEILTLEKEVKETLTDKQDALKNFEETTRYILEQEIETRARPRMEELSSEIKNSSADLKKTEQTAKELNKYITATYEAFLGKEYVNEEDIQEMITLMDEENLSTVAEVLSLYKAEH